MLLSNEDYMELLLAETAFLEDECGVDGDALGWHWAAHMLRLGYPELTERDADGILQEVGWH
jgi:hypothetical protein